VAADEARGGEDLGYGAPAVEEHAEELEDEYDGEHEECEAGVVAELDQVLGDALLFLDVLVERVQVLGEKACGKETMSK